MFHVLKNSIRNSLGIKEFIHTGNQHISSLISKIRQVEILRVQLQDCVDFVAETKLLWLKCPFWPFLK